MDPKQLPDGAPDPRLGPGGLHRFHEALGPGNFYGHLVTLIVFLLVLALLVFLLYRLLSRSGGGRWTGHSSVALRELELRYARGEIDRDEFLQRRADLTTAGLPPPASPRPPAAPPPPSQTPSRRAARAQTPPPPDQATG